MLWTSTSLSLKTSFPALIFFQKINFLRPVFSWGSARRWLHSQAVKLAPYNRLIKRLLIAEIWMMEAEDMDPLALVFHSVLCSRGRIAHSKWKRSRIHDFLKKKQTLTGATFWGLTWLNFCQYYWALVRIITSRFNGCRSAIKRIVFLQFPVYLMSKHAQNRIQGLTRCRLKVRVCRSPESLQPLIDTSSLVSRAGANTPQNICSQTALMEPYWHRTRTRHPHLTT